MAVGSTIARVFAVLAMVGVVLSPMARSVMAMPAAKSATMDEHMGVAAPDDRPCCPGKPSLPDCDKDCPFMALCGAMMLHNVSQTSLIIPLTLAAVVLPGEASPLVSLAYAPPQKPPKA